MVGKVRRSDRKYLASGPSFGRLCDECVTALFHGQTALREHPALGHVKLAVVKNREVA
jgi:hypothetical protein